MGQTPSALSIEHKQTLVALREKQLRQLVAATAQGANAAEAAGAAVLAQSSAASMQQRRQETHMAKAAEALLAHLQAQRRRVCEDSFVPHYFEQVVNDMDDVLKAANAVATLMTARPGRPAMSPAQMLQQLETGNDVVSGMEKEFLPRGVLARREPVSYALEDVAAGSFAQLRTRVQVRVFNVSVRTFFVDVVDAVGNAVEVQAASIQCACSPFTLLFPRHFEFLLHVRFVFVVEQVTAFIVRVKFAVETIGALPEWVGRSWVHPVWPGGTVVRYTSGIDKGKATIPFLTPDCMRAAVAAPASPFFSFHSIGDSSVLFDVRAKDPDDADGITKSIVFYLPEPRSGNVVDGSCDVNIAAYFLDANMFATSARVYACNG